MLKQTSYQFPVQLKLRTAISYQKAFKGPIKLVAGNIKLFAVPNSLGYPRLGMAISRKKMNKAVMRNCTKRIIREGFRLHQHQLQAVDIVMISLRKVEMVDKRKLQAWLNTLWKQLSNS